MKKLSILLVSIVLLFSCETEEVILFTEMPHIYFNLTDSVLHAVHPGSTAKSILVDFADKPDSVTTDTLILGVRVSGVVSTEDRLFGLETILVNGGVQEGQDYEFLNSEFLVPANEYDTVVRLVVHRTAAIRDSESVILVQMEANENFQLGPQNDTIGNIRVTDVTIRMRDIVVQPANWASFLVNYFGTYSAIKYRLIINTLNLTSFSSSTSAAEMNRYRIALADALHTYNVNNGQPLRDENGELVSF